jgi:hypothetical protein
MKFIYLLLVVGVVLTCVGVDFFRKSGASTDTGDLAPTLMSGGTAISGIVLLLVGIVVLVLSGCAFSAAPPPPTPAPRIIDSACKWVPRLTASHDDTPATKREILAYEQARQENCPDTLTPSR